MIELINNIWTVVLDTAFWLLVGLLAAGIIKTYIPEKAIRRWVGGKGFGAISRAALIGAPLPLCSCGVLPAAIGLHRAGASKEATVSFLISTPETSVDSVAVTYALMGPVMAIYRPVAALISAMVTGMLTSLIKDEVQAVEKPAVDMKPVEFNPNETAVDVAAVANFNPNETAIDVGAVANFNPNQTAIDVGGVAGFNPNETAVDAAGIGADFNPHDTLVEADIAKACCSSKPVEEVKSCCSSDSSGPEEHMHASIHDSRWFKSLKYAGAELLDDISKWLAIGIILAGVMLTFIPTGWLAEWGSGLSAMLIMLVVGVPLYICAVASTPVAAGLLVAGVSPGAVLVFLLVGPATNIASFALVKQELGMKVTVVYLIGISVISVIMGLLLEFLLANLNWEVKASLGHAHTMLPVWLAWSSSLLLVFLAIKPLRKAILPQLG